MEKRSASSARDRRAVAKGRATRVGKIDFSDIPKLSDEQLASMRRVGRPLIGDTPRKAVSIRLDQRLLEWVKRRAAEKNQPYQSVIHEILEKAMRRAG